MKIPEGNRRVFVVFYTISTIFILCMFSFFMVRESASGIIMASIPLMVALAGGYLTNDHFNKKSTNLNQGKE